MLIIFFKIDIIVSNYLYNSFENVIAFFGFGQKKAVL